MKRKKVQHKHEAHILVIRLSAMGDIAMTVPVLIALSRQYPQIKITVLSRSFFSPLFDEIPNVAFYEADVKGRHKGVSGIFKLSGELHNLGITEVADLHNVLRSNLLKFFLKLRGYKVVQIDKGRNEKKALTRGNNKVFKPLKTTHHRYAEVFKKLGFPLRLDKSFTADKKKLTPSLNAIIGPGNQKWVGIAPFAAFKGKTYPLDLMEKVIAGLDATNAYRIILLGGKNEGALLNNLASKYRSAVNVAGKMSFKEELCIISNLDLMLAMDSGNAHLSAMYGVKTITLWGVTHPYAGFYPYGQPEGNALLADRKKYPLIPTSVYGNKFPEGYEDAMRTISVNQVVDLIIARLNNN